MADKQTAIVLGAFYLVQGIGHFAGLRHCQVGSGKMRFYPILGGYVNSSTNIKHRNQEGFSSLGPSIMVLASAIIGFDLYILTNNSAYLLFSAICFVMNVLRLIPFIAAFEGCTIVKSILFSVRRYLGLAFLFLNIFVFPYILYRIMSQQGSVSVLGLSSAILYSLNMFTEELDDSNSKLAMNKFEILGLTFLYLLIFLASLYLPYLLEFPTINSDMVNKVYDIILTITILTLLIRLIVKRIKKYSTFWIRQVRRILDMI